MGVIFREERVGGRDITVIADEHPVAPVIVNYLGCSLVLSPDESKALRKALKRAERAARGER